jgi:hypothetical protein
MQVSGPQTGHSARIMNENVMQTSQQSSFFAVVRLIPDTKCRLLLKIRYDRAMLGYTYLEIES